jgi:hypothetical protein
VIADTDCPVPKSQLFLLSCCFLGIVSKRPSHRIPESLSHPFGEAAILLVDWKGGADEPVVTLEGKSVPIGFLFRLVAEHKFSDRLPAGLRELLLTYAGKEATRRDQLAELNLLPIYEIAAHCLQKWLSEKSRSE